MHWIVVGIMAVAALYFVLRPFFDRSKPKVPLVLVLGVPVFVAAAYALLFSPKPAGEPPVSAAPAQAVPRTTAGNDGKLDSVGNLVGGLAARLAENPDDGKGWLLLAQSYQHLGRTAEARDAYAKAKALGETSAALEALSSGSAATAPPGSGARISGTVTLDPALAADVRPTDTLFIFARPPGSQGPPAAVVRLAAANWPVRFSLSDADSMVQGLSLSTFEKVVVTARVSRSGNAAEALPGMEAVSESIDVDSGAPVELVIR